MTLVKRVSQLIINKYDITVVFFFFFQAEDGIRDYKVTGVQTCALPIFWDDPRMPTLAGARRRGYTPGGFRLFAERIGVSKAHQLIDFSVLEDCMRDDLNELAPRRMAVLDPVKLVIENFAADGVETLQLPNH